MDAPTSRKQPTLEADLQSLQQELHKLFRGARPVEPIRQGASAAEQQLVIKAK